MRFRRGEVLERLVDELLRVPARVWRAMFTDLLHYDDMADLKRITPRWEDPSRFSKDLMAFAHQHLPGSQARHMSASKTP